MLWGLCRDVGLRGLKLSRWLDGYFKCLRELGAPLTLGARPSDAYG